MITRPMKAAALVDSSVPHTDEVILAAMKALKHWPKVATIKMDGIRSVRTTDLFSARMKLIPNVSIRRRSMRLPYGFDAELVCPSSYDEVESIVMSEEHERSDEIVFHMIDWYSPMGYWDRLMKVREWVENDQMSRDDASTWDVHMPYYRVCYTPEELFAFFREVEDNHGEGICFRTMDSPYKFGYSTLREEWLIKLCRDIRYEVTVIGTYEQLLNKNRSKRNAIGMMDRSKIGERQIGKDTLGGFYVRNPQGMEFKVATGVGLTDGRRQELWDRRESLIGKTVTIKSKAHGVKVKPRSPVIVGFRNLELI